MQEQTQQPPIDMVAPLLALPPAEPIVQRLQGEGILVRRAKVWERPQLREFIKQRFAAGWVEEASVAFGNKPISAFLAFHGIEIVGFAAYECTYRGLFGPVGVDEAYRGRDMATALLLRCLEAMRAEGYIYAIIGLAGPRRFFEKACGAIAVPEDWPKYIFDG